MQQPTGHCPYVGLKQNRAIRFAAPTPEHRCYVTGEPIEIPVDQAHYCLSSGHIHCPLYTGSGLATMSIDGAVDDYVAPAPPAGVGGWISSLSPRDRAIYMLMLGLLVLIAIVAIVAGVRVLAPAGNARIPTLPVPTDPIHPTQAAIVDAASEVPTAVLPTPTDLPTSTPRVLPTETATQAMVFSPSQQPTNGSAATVMATTGKSSSATSVPASSIPTIAVSTAPAMTPDTATPVPPTTAPTNPPATNAPTNPPVSARTERMTLYFADPTGTLFVPVERNVRIENGQVAAAAIRALIAGPQNNLQRLVPANTQLLDVSITNTIAVVNFDRRPSITNDLGLQSIVQTLVQLPDINRVQFQVNGQNIGIDGTGPDAWAALNLLNPQNLPVDVSQATFLPLYFPAANGTYDVRIIRLVPSTKQTATATLRALLEGPGSYSGVVQQVIPSGTELRGIALSDGIATVNFSQLFASASDREAAVRTTVESLTTLPTIQGVQFLVEGRSLGELWGESYGQIFSKPAINAE